ncbi:MAG TPA: hypothetical protein VGN09_15210 [Vicinamibacteria bacterium]|jgi:hypothetical protein
MKRLIFGLILTTAAFSYAQSKPDFSGTWVLDREKSDPPGMGPGGGQGPGASPTGDVTITITQTGTELKLERETPAGKMTTAYALDGTESKNTGPRGGETRSKSHWDGEKLLTEGQQTMNGPDGPMTVDFKEVRRLDDDGKTMVVETTRTSARGTQTRKTVFTKKPAS